MRRQAFFADIANGTVRHENWDILIDCTPSQAKEIARQLNQVVAKALKQSRRGKSDEGMAKEDK